MQSRVGEKGRQTDVTERYCAQINIPKEFFKELLHNDRFVKRFKGFKGLLKEK